MIDKENIILELYLLAAKMNSAFAEFCIQNIVQASDEANQASKMLDDLIEKIKSDNN